MMDAALLASVFDKNPLLIAHMDQLARNEDLQDQDLVDLRAGGQGISSLGGTLRWAGEGHQHFRPPIERYPTER